MEPKPPGLSRSLGLSHAVAIVIGTIIGSGIFLVPAEMMQAVGSARLVYLVWIVGGALSFCGALTYAELGARRPQTGGEYVYVRDGYGPLAGFLYAWTWFLIAKPASIATITSGIVRVLGTIPQFSFLPHRMFGGVPLTWGQALAIALTIAISFLNYLGVKKAGDFQLIFTLLKIAIIVAIVAVGFSYHSGTWLHFSEIYPGATGGVRGFMAALVAALWAYDGWNDLNMVGGEIQRPERNIPVALTAGVAIVGCLYMAVNAVVQYVLAPAAVAASPRPAAEVMTLALGAIGGGVVAVAMAVSMLVTLNGTIMSGARIPFAVSRDGYFFSALGEVNPRFHTPSVAILVQAILAVLLLVLGGSFRQFFSLAIFAEWLFYMIAASTIFLFRKREPQSALPYKSWGYPVVPSLFLIASAVLLYFTFTENLPYSAYGLAVIAGGIPVFYWFSRKRSA